MARKANDKAAEVLQVAASLFETRGYRGTSMDDVANGVKLNKGTVYYYFPSKATILYEIYSIAQQLILDELEQIPPDASPDEALGGLIRAQLRVLAAYPSETVVYHQEKRWIREWLDDEQYRAIREREQVFTDFVIGLIERGMADGSFAEADPKITAFGLIGVTAWSYQWYDPRGRLQLDDIAALFEQLLLRGLRGPGPGPKVKAASPGRLRAR